MDEYISQKAVFQVVHGIARGIATKDIESLNAKDMKTFYKIKGAKEILDSVDTDLCYIPAADVQPVVHSKWTYGENESGKDGIFCSNCEEFVPWDYEYYDSPEELISDNPICSHCGAKMRTE